MADPVVKWAPHSQHDVAYDLSHLHPLAFTYTVESKNGLPEQDYVIDVVFSLHCFTRSWLRHEVQVQAECYADHRETRRFDVERYELSKKLPTIIAAVGARKLFHTRHGNYFTVEIEERDGAKRDYTIYFTLSRSKQRGRLTLFVQSA